MVRLVVTVVVAWWFTPRFCRLCDKWCSQRRLSATSTSPAPNSQTPVISKLPQHSNADIFESLAMSVRRGAHPLVALENLAVEGALPPSFTHIVLQQPTQPLWDVLTQLRESVVDTGEEILASLLLQSYRHGSLEPSALDVAAHTIRSNEVRKSRLLAATAHARITVRVLSILPALVLAVSCLFSEQVRETLGGPIGLILLFLGLVLNCVGYLWMRGISRSVEQLSQPSTLYQLLVSASISIEAGDSLSGAIEQWRHINPVGRACAEILASGKPLTTALMPLTNDCGPLGSVMRRLLIESHQSGTPLAGVVSRLRNDVEADSDRTIAERVQQMSTRLTLPIVFCTLPSFVLLALMPVAIASLGSLPSPTAI